MSARQIIVLVVAFIAAIGALLLIRSIGKNDAPAEAAAKVENVEGERVLVAARPIAQGAALQSADIQWVAFPTASVTENFISAASAPEAQTEFVGAITRRTFVAGEPIIVGSVVQPEGRSAMAAQLLPGYRAVSVEIDPESAAGGYIQPNDRVDVILTVKTNTSGGADRVRSDVVLQDVRILALGAATQPPAAGEGGPEAQASSTVVLELSADDARALEMADATGSLSLSLRGIADEPPGLRAPSARRGSAIDRDSNTVRIHAFGNARNGGGG
jgi:pilus assembly protein CpaB